MACGTARDSRPTESFAGTTGSTRCVIALCAVLGLILSAVLSARTEGKASPGRIWPEITALRAAYTTCSYNATPGWKDRRNGITCVLLTDSTVEVDGNELCQGAR